LELTEIGCSKVKRFDN